MNAKDAAITICVTERAVFSRVSTCEEWLWARVFLAAFNDNLSFQTRMVFEIDITVNGKMI